MNEKDGLNDFDFNKVTKPGKFLKFEAGKPVTIRVLTKDPVVSEVTFPGSDEAIARFNFVVWNFTDEKAQILSSGSNMSKTFQRVGRDEDFGANLQKCDIKISPEGEKLNRVYDINVLRHSGNEKELTSAMIKEAAGLDLLKEVKDNKGRLSEWTPPEKDEEAHDYGVADGPGHASAKNVRDALGNEDADEEKIDLSDIPF